MNTTTKSQGTNDGSLRDGENAGKRHHIAVITSLVAAACFGVTAMAQGHAPVSAVPAPTALKSKASALGERFVPGHERLILSGSITRPKAAPTPISLV